MCGAWHAARVGAAGAQPAIYARVADAKYVILQLTVEFNGRILCVCSLDRVVCLCVSVCEVCERVFAVKTGARTRLCVCLFLARVSESDFSRGFVQLLNTRAHRSEVEIFDCSFFY